MLWTFRGVDRSKKNCLYGGGLFIQKKYWWPLNVDRCLWHIVEKSDFCQASLQTSVSYQAICSSRVFINPFNKVDILSFFFMSRQLETKASFLRPQGEEWVTNNLTGSSEFMGKTFQAAQLTHERFLSSSTHQRSVEVQFGRYQKNILQEWSMVKNLSCVSCAAWNVFPINSLLSGTIIKRAQC